MSLLAEMIAGVSVTLGSSSTSMGEENAPIFSNASNSAFVSSKIETVRRLVESGSRWSAGIEMESSTAAHDKQRHLF